MAFDPKDEECWNFGPMTRLATNEMLLHGQEAGVFLVRDSSSYPGDFVLCVRDGLLVRNYRIIKQTTTDATTFYRIGDKKFHNMASLLAYYRDHAIDTNSTLRLLRPACMREPVSRPQSLDSNDSAQSSLGVGLALPAFAFAKSNRIPSAYDKTALTLHEGDLVKVTKINVNGTAEGLCNGKFGKFPFHLLDFSDEN